MNKEECKRSLSSMNKPLVALITVITYGLAGIGAFFLALSVGWIQLKFLGGQ